MKKDISIIIATYNRAPLLNRTLQSLSKQVAPSGVSIELLVVDNNSIDSTKAVVESWIPKIPFETRYYFENRQGKSNALNHAIDKITGEFVLFTDDDVIVDKEWVYSMYQASKKYQSASGFGGKIVPVWPEKIPGWLLIKGQRRLKVITPESDMGESDRAYGIKEAPSGCNSAFRSSVFKKGFRFRSDLGYVGTFIMPGEDTQFAHNLIRNNHLLMYVSSALVFHPALPERLTKKYARSRYFNIGRASVRAFGDSKYADLPKIFGIYRYLIQDSVAVFLRSLGYICLGRWGESFYYEMKLFSNAGMVYELLKQKNESNGKKEMGYANRN